MQLQLQHSALWFNKYLVAIDLQIYNYIKIIHVYLPLFARVQEKMCKWATEHHQFEFIKVLLDQHQISFTFPLDDQWTLQMSCSAIRHCESISMSSWYSFSFTLHIYLQCKQSGTTNGSTLTCVSHTSADWLVVRESHTSLTEADELNGL